MSKLDKTLDKFPIVRALRFTAAFLLFLTVIEVINNVIWPHFVAQDNQLMLVPFLQLMVVNIGNGLFRPMILLALAEIIKAQREKDKNRE
jgi:hypothetical protein